jgi:hypothetical protein
VQSDNAGAGFKPYGVYGNDNESERRGGFETRPVFREMKIQGGRFQTCPTARIRDAGVYRLLGRPYNSIDTIENTAIVFAYRNDPQM